LAARSELNIEPDCFVVTFVAVNARKNSWKDYTTFESAALQLASKYPARKILFQVLGDRHDPITCGKSRIEFIDGITDKSKICSYLRASDVYLHSARVDNYPLAILEALSCGLPVIASAVGGIPEQVLGYEKFQQALSQSNRSHIETATGLLVDPMSSEQQILALETLIFDQKLRSTLSHNAIIDSKKRFNLKNQSQLYIEWFNEIVQSKGSAR
jgi:glycosyltransferase involved in cell wall biosynthesis